MGVFLFIVVLIGGIVGGLGMGSTFADYWMNPDEFKHLKRFAMYVSIFVSCECIVYYLG